MGLTIPNRRDVVAALQSYVRSYLPELDPSTSRRSYIGGQVKSLGSALHDWYVALKRYGDNEPFPQTASRQFLFAGWWVDITKLNPNPASPARGVVALPGVSGTIIGAGTEFSANGVVYSSDRSTTIVAQTLRPSSLIRNGSAAIFETIEDHNLASGMIVEISGAAQSEYNGSFAISVTAANEFTYQITGTPITPATGNPVLSASWGIVAVTSTTTGPDSNLDAGGSMSTASVAGFDGVGLVTFGGIGGGSTEESTDSFRQRQIEALGTDFGMFSPDEIRIVAKTVPGVTRVWVRRATLGATNGVPEGQVRVAFMRDRDANPFPSAHEVNHVRSIILGIAPSHTADEDVIVESPSALAVDFNFSSINPDTGSMRRAINATLLQFFVESVDYGVPIDEDIYRCAIMASYDQEGKTALKSFSLASPNGTIAVSANQLPRLGNVTFPG